MNLTDDPTHRHPEAGGWEQEREDDQAREESEGAESLGCFADHVVGLLHRDLAGEVPADDDRAVQVGATLQRGSVVELGGVVGEVAADQDVGGFAVEGQ